MKRLLKWQSIANGMSLNMPDEVMVRCRDCAKRDTEDCPMRFWDEYDDGYTDNTKDDGFCDRGEKYLKSV